MQKRPENESHTRRDAMDMIEDRLRHIPITQLPAGNAYGSVQPVIVKPSRRGKACD